MILGTNCALGNRELYSGVRRSRRRQSVHGLSEGSGDGVNLVGSEVDDIVGLHGCAGGVNGWLSGWPVVEMLIWEGSWNEECQWCIEREGDDCR